MPSLLLVAFAVTLVALPPIVVALNRWQLLDAPNARSAHLHPTPRGGGLAIALGCAVAVLVASLGSGPTPIGLLIAAGGFGLIGLADDLRGVDAIPRLAAQVVVALAALPWLLAGLDRTGLWLAAFGVAAVVGLVAYVNAFNFMDGINGISAAQTIVAGVAWMAVAELTDTPVLALGGGIAAASAAAFLPFNFPSAKVFLGDIGSYFIGAWLASCVVLGVVAGIPPEAVVAPLAIYFADTGVTLVRRVLGGATWHEAHCDHAYQALHHGGWSHARTTALVTLAMGLCAALGFVAIDASPGLRLVAVAGILTVVTGYLLTPTLVDRRRHATISSAP